MTVATGGRVKIFPAVLIFPENDAYPCKICVEIWNLLKYLVGLHTQALQTIDFYIHSNFNKKRTKIIFIEIYAVLLLANLGAIYAFFVGICG